MLEFLKDHNVQIVSIVYFTNTCVYQESTGSYSTIREFSSSHWVAFNKLNRIENHTNTKEGRSIYCSISMWQKPIDVKLNFASKKNEKMYFTEQLKNITLIFTYLQNYWSDKSENCRIVFFALLYPLPKFKENRNFSAPSIGRLRVEWPSMQVRTRVCMKRDEAITSPDFKTSMWVDISSPAIKICRVFRISDISFRAKTLHLLL